MSDGFHYDLICIGSGPAGQRCAIQAAKLGKKVALIEKRRIVGGVCLETGTIPSKTFREAVRAFMAASRRDHGTGFAGKARPTVQNLLKHVNGVIQRETDVQRDQLQRNDINIILGAASFTGPNTVLVDTENGRREITAEKFMIAVGTTPAAPPGVKPDGVTLIDSDGMMHLDAMPRTLTVVGAGVIGMEYASMFAQMSVDVTVVDMRERPMGFLDHEIIDELMYQMRSRDVTFRLGEKVEKVEIVDEPPRPQGVITLESGKHIISDLILYSAGRQGNTRKLHLDAAGLKADKRGRLKVNENYQTSVPHVYAAGDVIGFPSLAATSAEQGRRAGGHMFGVHIKEMGEKFPFGIYSIPEISMVGQTEEQLTEAKVPYETGIARYKEIARGHILGDDSGLLKLIFHRETGKLLGAHAIGTGATELIHVGQAVLIFDGGLDYFLDTVFNYPTLAECYKVAALNAYNKLRRDPSFALPIQ